MVPKTKLEVTLKEPVGMCYSMLYLFTHFVTKQMHLLLFEFKAITYLYNYQKLTIFSNFRSTGYIKILKIIIDIPIHNCVTKTWHIVHEKNERNFVNMMLKKKQN